MNPVADVRLRLYIAGDTHNSAQALSNLTSICQQFPDNRCEFEIVDVFREPKRALADGILMTPTLVKLQPDPVRKVVGTLNDHNQLLKALGLEPFL